MKYFFLPLASGILLAGSLAMSASFERPVAQDHLHNVIGVEELSHGGGLDACGGHWDRKKGTYHYHRKRC